MLRFLAIFPAMLMVLSAFNPAWAASGEAMKLRASNGLSEFAPPESFLNGNFVADEIEPQYVFGKVKDFWKSRSCPTGWFIEDSEKKRIASPENQTGPIEYTLYLEEDCHGKVTHYVFVDRSRAKADQWMEWRKLFHKSKTEQQYGAASSLLEQASKAGFPVDSELRFISVGGELISKRPEDFLTVDLKVKPVYDFRRGPGAGDAGK